uniref:Uncharacterized protein n=1 Tax=viral metagenome TaxID=1070528 RepID=A0A6M3J1D4_9ZZZZ
MSHATNPFDFLYGMDNLMTYLKRIVEEGDDPTNDPYFNAMDESGGNFDDAFSMGVEAGRVKLANEILKQYL